MFYYVVLFILLYADLFIEGAFIQTVEFSTLSILFINIILSYKKFDLFDGLILLFSSYAIIISALNHTLSFGILYSLLLIAILPIFIKKELTKSNNILKCLYVLSIIIIILNFITILYPLGADSDNLPIYLLGGKNALAIYEMPMMFYVIFYSYVRHKKLIVSNLLYIILIIASLIMGGSSTGVVVAILCIIYLACPKFINFGHRTYLLVFSLIQILVLNVSILHNIPYISDFITNFLGKDITFTGRTYLWSIATKAIGKSFFGYGSGNSVMATYSIYSECHSAILEILLTGGVILLILYISVVLSSFLFKKTKENRRLYLLSSFFLFAYLIIGLTESVQFKIEFWIMFALIISINKIVANAKEDGI
jgi:O-antigen ligase